MNKKALGLLVALSLGAIAGCGNNNSTSSSATVAEKYSVGLGYTESFKAGQLDVTTAFAAFDKDGKVFDVRFDVVQVKFTANEAKDGLTLTNTNIDADYSVTTKLELGSAYNMQGSSYIGKEVNEQIEAFADFCVGKTVEEVIAATVNPGHSSDGTPVCDDLAGKVTITVDAFEAALSKAYATKSETTYELSGTAGVAMKSGLAYNYGNPANSLYSDIAGVVANGGIVEAALIDAIVIPISFEDGITIKNDDYYFRDGVLRSKKVLGDEYAMKGVGNNPATGETCTKEWYEQAAIVEKAAEGKTKAEISAFVANEGELAGATITLTNYIKALAKATDYAGRAVINDK